MQTNRFKSNGKTQTIPSCRFRTSAYSKKGLKDCLERIFWYPRAMVPDRKKNHRLGSAGVHFQNDLDAGSRLCEADCVANDVFTSASKGMWIRIPENHRTCCMESDGLAQRLCFEVAVSCRFLDEASEVYVFSLRRRQPGFKAR